MARVILIDNYDSFTWNLWHCFGRLQVVAEVVRNDQISVEQLLDSQPQAVILSPGPATPDRAGICLPFLQRAPASLPIFGVCLGMQAISQAAGAKIVPAKQIVHGKVSPIAFHPHPLFQGLESPIMAARYHSLAIEPQGDRLKILAWAQDDTIMAVEDTRAKRFGVLFHPESIGTVMGDTIIENFVRLCL